MDVTSTAQSMWMAAADLGLASSWITGFRERGVREILEIPPNVQVIGLLAVGYSDGFGKLPPRREISQVISWERWSQEVEIPGRP